MGRDGTTGSKAGGLQRGSADPRPPRRMPRGVKVAGVVAGVAVAGVAAFLLLGGHFTEDPPPVRAHYPSERERKRAEAEQRAADKKAAAEAAKKAKQHEPPKPREKVVPLPPVPGTAAYLVGQYAVGTWLVDVRSTDLSTIEIHAFRTDAAGAGKTNHREIGRPQAADVYGRFMNSGALRWDDGADRIEVHVGTPSSDTFERGPAATHCLCFGMGGEDKIPEGCDAERFRVAQPGKAR